MDYAFVTRQRMSQELCEIGQLYLIVGITAVLAILAIPAVSFLT